MLTTAIRIFLVLIALSISGCNRILLSIYGIKDPKPQHEEYIIDYYKQKLVGVDKLYTFADTMNLNRFYAKKYHLPLLLVFEKNGYLIKSFSQNACNGELTDVLLHLDANSPNYTIDSLVNFSDALNGCKLIWASQKEWGNQHTRPDFIAIFYWGTFLGKLNNTLNDWEAAVSKRNDVNFKIYAVSCDISKEWLE